MPEDKHDLLEYQINQALERLDKLENRQAYHDTVIRSMDATVNGIKEAVKEFKNATSESISRLVDVCNRMEKKYNELDKRDAIQWTTGRVATTVIITSVGLLGTLLGIINYME